MKRARRCDGRVDLVLPGPVFAKVQLFARKNRISTSKAIAVLFAEELREVDPLMSDTPPMTDAEGN